MINGLKIKIIDFETEAGNLFWNFRGTVWMKTNSGNWKAEVKDLSDKYYKRYVVRLTTEDGRVWIDGLDDRLDINIASGEEETDFFRRYEMSLHAITEYFYYMMEDASMEGLKPRFFINGRKIEAKYGKLPISKETFRRYKTYYRVTEREDPSSITEWWNYISSMD